MSSVLYGTFRNENRETEWNYEQNQQNKQRSSFFSPYRNRPRQPIFTQREGQIEKHERQRHREKDPEEWPVLLTVFQILAPTPCEVHLEFLCLDPEKHPSDRSIHSVEVPNVGLRSGTLFRRVPFPHQNPRVATEMPTPLLIN